MITLYLVAKYIHITGAAGLFAALIMEWVALKNIYNDKKNNIEPWVNTYRTIHRFYGPSWIAVLAAGIYMMSAVWGFNEWLGISIILMILWMITGAVLGRRYINPILLYAAGNGSSITEIKNKFQKPVILNSLKIRSAVALLIIFLMTVKPDLYNSLFVTALAMVIAIISALTGQKKRAKELQENLMEKSS